MTQTDMTHKIQRAFDGAQDYTTHATVQQRSARDLLVFANHHLDCANLRTILEVGCGDGALTTLLHTTCPHANITALDIAPSLLALAQTTLPHTTRLNWQCGDIADFQYPATDFDCVYANFSLQWLTQPQQIFTQMLAHSRSLCFALPLASSCRALKHICAEYGAPLMLRDLPTVEMIHDCSQGHAFHTYFRPYWMMFDTPLAALGYFKQIGAHASEHMPTTLLPLRTVKKPISLHFDVAHCVVIRD